MNKPRVIIIMGSPTDKDHCDAIAAALDGFGLVHESRIGSAHKTPGHLVAMLEAYEAAGGPRVYITVAGRSNALSGFVDGAVDAPVLACPPPSAAFGGADVWSSLRMPGGIAPTLVLDPAGAALASAKILGLADPVLAERVSRLRAANAEAIVAADEAMRDDSIKRSLA